MAIINKTSEMEYCEKCGTMLMMGICRRCNPKTKIIKKLITKSGTPNSSKMIVHDIGITYVKQQLLTNDIFTHESDKKRIDLILDNGKTILIRASYDINNVAFLINGDIESLIADYLIIVTELKYTNPNIYIMTMKQAKEISLDSFCERDDHNEYFITKNEYSDYQNKYETFN